VLLLEPAGAEAELDPAARHLVDLGNLDREDPRRPVGHRGDEGAEADARGLPGQAGEGGPGIRRARQAGHVVAHGEVVVGAEERVETERLRGLGDGEDVVVRAALLRFGEDAESH